MQLDSTARICFSSGCEVQTFHNKFPKLPNTVIIKILNGDDGTNINEQTETYEGRSINNESWAFSKFLNKFGKSSCYVH